MTLNLIVMSICIVVGSLTLWNGIVNKTLTEVLTGLSVIIVSIILLRVII